MVELHCLCVDCEHCQVISDLWTCVRKEVTMYSPGGEGELRCYGWKAKKAIEEKKGGKERKEKFDG